MKTEQTLGIYLHIPFCLQKCAYCDFYSLVKSEEKEAYTDALCTQISLWAPRYTKYTVDSIYFGGGTPSLLPASFLQKIMDTLRQSFSVDMQAEWSMEMNPATMSITALDTLRKAGMNRLSIGVQSLQATELRWLSRLHTAEEAEETYLSARKAGFDNINIDLMYGIPAQTRESFQNSLQKVLQWQPEHLSAYGLKIEGNTPFSRQKDSLPFPDEDTESDMYLDLITECESAGLLQYEISNFARPGYPCRHNLKYWNTEPYLGFGVAAHSFMEQERFSCRCDLHAYLDAAKKQDFSSVIQTEESLTQTALLEEYAMLRLRLTDGISDKEMQRRFGISFSSHYGEIAQKYCKTGFLKKENDTWSFTKKGFLVSNTILSDLLDL